MWFNKEEVKKHPYLFILVLLFAFLLGFWKSYLLKSGEAKGAGSSLIKKEETLNLVEDKKLALTKTVELYDPLKVSLEPLKEAEKSSLKIDKSKKDCLKKHEKAIKNNNFFERNKTEISKVIGEWFFDKSKAPDLNKDMSVQETFLLGLKMAGLSTSKGFKSDKALGRELLLESANMDEENSAPWVFLLILAKEEGDLEDIAFYKKKISKTTYFNNYTLDISRKLFSKIETPFDTLEAFGAVSGVALPSVFNKRKVLIEQKLKKPSLQIINSTLQNDSFVDMVDWIPLEYAIARGTIKALGLPYEKYPDFKELWKGGKNEFFDTFAEYEKECDLTKLNPFINKIKKRSLEYLR